MEKMLRSLLSPSRSLSSALSAFPKSVKRAITKLYMDVDVTSDVKVITPEMAAYLQKNCMYDRQRPLRGASLSGHGFMFERGAGRPGAQMCAALIGDFLQVIDGQHRLNLLADIVKAPMPVTFTVYHCRSMAQVHDLYVTFDNGIGNRSAADMYVAYYGNQDVEQIGRSAVGKLLAATSRIVVMFSENMAKASTHDMKLHCVMANRLMPEMRKLAAILKTGKIQPAAVMKQATLAVALLTLKWKPKKATAFWKSIINYDFCGAGDPCCALSRFFDDQTRLPSRDMSGHRQQKNPRQLSQIVANCWNRFFRGELLDNAEHGAGDQHDPILIAGTSFNHPRTSKLFIHGLAALGVPAAQFALLKKHGRGASTRRVAKKRTSKEAK